MSSVFVRTVADCNKLELENTLVTANSTVTAFSSAVGRVLQGATGLPHIGSHSKKHFIQLLLLLKYKFYFALRCPSSTAKSPPPPPPRTSCFWRWLSWWYLQHSSGCSSLLIGLLFLMCWSLRICLALFIFCFSVVLGSFRVEQQQGSSHLLPYT